MSTTKSLNHCHVTWSPNQTDKFIAISSDVKLFEFSSQSNRISQIQTHPSQQLIDSNNSFATQASTNSLPKNYKSKYNDYFMNSRLIASGPEIHNFKAASCYRSSLSDEDTLVAISCSNAQSIGGKIMLVCLRPSAVYSIDNYSHVDIVTRRSVCNDVDWSPINHSLLATAWDRYKIDNSLQIFDINRIVDTAKYPFNFSMTPNNRPVFDGCSGDYVNSLKWLMKEGSIVCGTNNKNIRMFDMRDLTKARLMTQTRAVFGLTVDPFSDKRFASYAENSIYIWDSRFFDKPLVTISESKPISQISWCSTRNHHFSALMTGEHSVKIYDIQQASLFSEDFDAKIVERLIHPFAVTSLQAASTTNTNTSNGNYDINMSSASAYFGQSSAAQKQITSYDWHPTEDSRLIAISNTRDVIALNVCDRITLNWSPICEIVWTKGKKILQCLDSRDEKYKSLDDISVNMRYRAITNYGMIVEDGPHHQRGDDSDLIGLLRWVKLAKSLDISNSSRQGIDGSTNNPIFSEILGVGTLIRSSNEQTSSRVEVRTISWTGFHSSSSCLVAPARVQVYHSEIRSRALLLCDWIPDIDNISQTIPIIDYLEKEGNYLRAAAIAVFNMRLQRAIESLTLGARRGDSNLSSVAMALSGYTGERSSVWREMCQNLKGQLNNPYMKAMFAFLTCDSDSNFNEITDDKELILVDRVAFSLLYLPDDKLSVYLSETMSTLVDNGDLNGILLTGITNDGLNLLERYIEISSDIQSVSLIVLHSLPSLICSDKRAQLWVECYRGMLDCWRLWHHRAQFDNLWYSNAANQAKPPVHILINCNFCGNPINKTHQLKHPHIQNSHLIHHYNAQSSIQSSNLNASTTGSHGLSFNQQNQSNSSLTHNINDYFQQRQAATLASATNTINISSQGNQTIGLSSINADSSPSASLGIAVSQQVNQQSPSSSVGSSMPSTITTTFANIQSSNNSATLSQQTIVPNMTTTSGNISRNPNCIKCSYAKCCLCLTQLGSNAINDTMASQSFKNQQRPYNLSLTSEQSASLALASSKLASSKIATKNSTTTAHQLSNWFSWCQTCRHGAHSAHLLSWFSENSECPVSGCECKCMNLDSRTQFDDASYLNCQQNIH